MTDRWVCKRCFADNDGMAAACQRCGLIRGAEATDADQSAWSATPQAAESGGGVLPQLLRFWWIPAIVVALVIGYFTTARRGDDGSLETAGNVDVFELRVGDCFNNADLAGSDEAEVEVSGVDGVPCSEPHAFEVYAVADYTGATYPATEEQFGAAFSEVCVPPFESYVGLPYADSVLWASAITPTEEGWNSGDREFVCHLFEDGAPMLTGSQRGANR